MRVPQASSNLVGCVCNSPNDFFDYIIYTINSFMQVCHIAMKRMFAKK